jgi:signal transduction histidine kinase
MLNPMFMAQFPACKRVAQTAAPHSFRLLLYVEWLLLGLAVLTSFLPMPPFFSTQPSFITFLCTFGFGVLGLRLVNGRLIHRVLYTLLQFGLLFLPVLLNERNRAFPFLVTIIVIRSCQIFKPRECWTVLLLALASFSWNLVQESQQLSKLFDFIQSGKASQNIFSPNRILLMQFSGSISFGLMLVAVMLLVNSLLSTYQSRQQLAVAHERLRQYALRIENQATLQERNRIAREIHDSLGHALTAQIIQLENALIFCPTDAEKTRFSLAQARQLCSRALHEVRQSVATLRSSPPKEQSLDKLIRAAVQEFQQISEISVECSIANTQTLPAEVNIMIYRIVQEALINIYKHSRASSVQIELQETSHHLFVSVRDDGQGFDPEQNRTGFGLQGMQERAATFNGQLRMISQPNSGCKVVVLVPLLKQEPNNEAPFHYSL